MCKGTKDASGAVPSLLDVVAFAALVYLWMELLLRACVAVLACVTTLTVARFAPLVTVLHVWTGSRSRNKIMSVNKTLALVTCVGAVQPATQ